MQTRTQGWIDTNRDYFTRKTYMWLRIQSANYPTGKLVNADDIISFSHIKNGDFLSGSLTQDKITFTVRNVDGYLDYDEENQNDYYENASVVGEEAFLSADLESYDGVPCGQYYVTEVKHDSDYKKYTFTAATITAFMTDECGYMTGDAYTVATDIIALANASKGVPCDDITLICDQDLLESMSITILESDRMSLAAALQLIASACDCIMYVDRTGRIHIEQVSDTPVEYVISKHVSYQPVNVEYASRVGNVELFWDHGNGVTYTQNEGDKIGGTQIMTNPLIDSDNDEVSVLIPYVNAIYSRLTVGRKRFTAKVRFDPALDLFDVIYIPNGKFVNTAVVTSINASYNGAWKADIKAVNVGIQSSHRYLRICDIEELTIEQFENIIIDDLAP